VTLTSAVQGVDLYPLLNTIFLAIYKAQLSLLEGHFSIEKLDRVMWSLYKDYGKVVKVGGLIGHPDLVFVFDGNYIEHVFRQEEVQPHRPSMPSLRYYKQHLRKDFFGDSPGLIGM
jgi:cytochrome P450 family 49 subfamily A